MAKSIKLTNDIYWSSDNIIHDKQTLKDIVNFDCIRVTVSSRYSYTHASWDAIQIKLGSVDFCSNEAKFSLVGNNIKIGKGVHKILVYGEIDLNISSTSIYQCDMYIRKNSDNIYANYGSNNRGITNLNGIQIATVKENDLIGLYFHSGLSGNVQIYEKCNLLILAI